MGFRPLQLVAKGNQDIPLVGNPQITFFKSVYKRHTHFASEWINIFSNGNINFGNLFEFTIPRNADLLGETLFTFVLPQISVASGKTIKWVEKIGHAMIDYIEIFIGNNSIVKHTGEWLELWSQLTLPTEKQNTYNNMIGHVGSVINESSTINEYRLYIPFQFWFCKDIGLALPLVALTNNDVKIQIKLKPFKELIHTSEADLDVTIGTHSANLMSKFYYLDSQERERFSIVSHKYLIEELQFNGTTSIGVQGSSVNFNFNLPVKELIWVVQRSATVSTTHSVNSYGTYEYNNHFDYTSSPTSGVNYNMVIDFSLTLENEKLFESREAQFFNLYLPYLYHSQCPSTGVFLYSFAEKPEEYQPSGSCNFSRLSNSTISCRFNNEGAGQKFIKIYATNYNFLEINNGVGVKSYQT